MHTTLLAEIAAQRTADLHREAAKQRLLRELRASRKPTARWAFVRITGIPRMFRRPAPQTL